MPSSKACSSSAGATATDLRKPSTSVNHSRTNRMSRSSERPEHELLLLVHVPHPCRSIGLSDGRRGTRRGTPVSREGVSARFQNRPDPLLALRHDVCIWVPRRPAHGPARPTHGPVRWRHGAPPTPPCPLSYPLGVSCPYCHDHQRMRPGDGGARTPPAAGAAHRAARPPASRPDAARDAADARPPCAHLPPALGCSLMHEPSRPHESFRLHEPSRRAVLGAGIAAAGGGLLGACSPSGGEYGMDNSGLGGRGTGRGDPVAVHLPARPGGPGPRKTAGTRPGPARPAHRRRHHPGPRRPQGEVLGVRGPGARPGDPGHRGRDPRPHRRQPAAAADTSVHWHGVALRNDMDGVPGITQPPIKPGTHLHLRVHRPRPRHRTSYHPHTGVQLDRGLYGVLVVDDPAEPRPLRPRVGRRPRRLGRRHRPHPRPGSAAAERRQDHGPRNGSPWLRGTATGASGTPPMSRHGGKPAPSPPAPARSRLLTANQNYCLRDHKNAASAHRSPLARHRSPLIATFVASLRISQICGIHVRAPAS